MNDSKKPKVVSLADHRKARLPLVGFSEHFDKPINAAWFDAWVESDGSIVIRIDKARLTYEANGIGYGRDAEAPAFKARGNAYELRVAPIDVPSFVRDVEHVGHTSRRRVEHQRGDHLWRCTPNGDGTFTVEHGRERAKFEPFTCRLRKGYVPTENGRQERRLGVKAPTCEVCRRVVQAGETMYRERREPNRWGNLGYHKFGHAELCSTCITKTPNTGIGEVG